MTLEEYKAKKNKSSTMTLEEYKAKKYNTPQVVEPTKVSQPVNTTPSVTSIRSATSSNLSKMINTVAEEKNKKHDAEVKATAELLKPAQENFDSKANKDSYITNSPMPLMLKRSQAQADIERKKYNEWKEKNVVVPTSDGKGKVIDRSEYEKQQRLAEDIDKWKNGNIYEKADVLLRTPAAKVALTAPVALAEMGEGIFKMPENIMDLGGTIGLNVSKKVLDSNVDSIINSYNKELDKYFKEHPGLSEEEKRRMRLQTDSKISQAITPIMNRNQKAVDEVKDKIAKDYVGERFKDLETVREEYSYLPEAGAEIARSVGYQIPSLLATAGASSALGATTKIPEAIGLGVFGLAAGGGGAERALQQDATPEQALSYGILSGTMETGVEALSGFIGGTVGNKFGSKVLSKEARDKIAQNIIGKYGLRLLDLGLDVTSEGVEEVISEVADPFLKRMTYDKDADLATIEDMQNAFWGGVYSSLVFVGGRAAAEGSTINSSKYKQMLKEQIAQNMEEYKNNNPHSQYIPRNYNSSADITFQNANKPKSLEELVPTGKNNVQNDTQNVQNKQTNEINQANSKNVLNANSEVNTNKNTITEALLGKPLTNEIEANEVDAKTKETEIKSANETAQLYKEKFGKNTNVFWDNDPNIHGYTDGNETYLNAHSNRDKIVTMLHEYTHNMELAEEYNKYAQEVVKSNMFNEFLQQKASEYGMKNITLEQYQNKIKDLYKEKKGIDLDDTQVLHEVISNFSSESKLFNSQEAIDRLAVENNNIFYKIKEWIDTLVTKVTGTAEEKELRRIQDMYVKASRQAMEQTRSTQRDTMEYLIDSKPSDKGVQVIYNNDGTVNRIKTNEDIFKNNEGKSIAKTIKEYLEEHINEYADIIESGQKVYLGEDLPSEYAYSENMKELSARDKLAKGRAATGLKEIIGNATNRRWESNKKAKHNQNAKYGFYRYDTTFSFEYNGKEKIYTGTVLIRNDANGKKYLYDILDVHPKKISNGLPLVASNSKSSAINSGSNSSLNNSIQQNKKSVNTEYTQDTQNDTENSNKSSFSISENKQGRKVIEQYYELYSSKADSAYNARDEYQQKYDSLSNKSSEEAENVKSKINFYQEQANEFNKKAKEYAKQLDDLGRTETEKMTAEEKRSKAIEEFGYTPYFYDAGYLLPDGKLLNLSGEKGRHTGQRGEDHRIISQIYNHLEGTEAVQDFINDGNVRVMAETPGIDIGVKTNLTQSQYSKIKDMVDEYKDKGYFSVDFSDAKGNIVESLEYEGKFSATQIANDIKTYLETGKRTKQSEVQKYRNQYSIEDKNKTRSDDINTTSKSQQYEKRHKNLFLKNFSSAMGISEYANTNGIKQMISEVAEQVKNKDYSGKDKLFEEMFNNGIVVNDEYYNQYKDLKSNIKKTKLYVPDSVKSSIADYSNFRKQNLSNVTLTSDNGNISIDTFYQELNEQYPDMFPETISTPADQLERIVEVSQSIEKSKQEISQYAENNEEYKQWAKEEFDKAWNNFVTDMNQVAKYEQEKQEKKDISEVNKNMTQNVTVEDLKNTYAMIKEYRKQYEKINSKELVTDKDRVTLDRLIKGEITFDEIPKNSNKEVIKKLYDAKKPLRELEDTIKAYNKTKKQLLREEARDLIKNSNNWKEKLTGIQYSREIMERNFRDVAGKTDGKLLNETYAEPVHIHEAEATRMKNKYREQIKDLNLSTKEKYNVAYVGEFQQGRNPNLTEAPTFKKVSESGLVQLYGEGKINDATLQQVGADVEKIKNAVKVFRQIYNELLEMSNESLMANGYAPVEYRQNYFPHFIEEKGDTVLSKVGSMLGINTNTTELPTDIAGISHTFRPGKKWVGNFLQRTTEVTDFDALKGFDRYIEGVADVIYHTEDIQKLRALEDEIRYKYSDKGVQEAIDNIREDDSIAPEDKANRIEEIYQTNKNEFPHLVTWLRSYTDSLAGKKSIEDRIAEQQLGRAVYDISKSVENRVSANMIGLNVNSWLTNFIPLAQAVGTTKSKYLLNAMHDTIKNYMQDDGFRDKSTFLTNRRGSEALVQKGIEKLNSKLDGMRVIDDFTSETLTRARYYQNVAKGMSIEEAIRDADINSAKIMGDRSKGSTPTLFNTKNPVSKLLTMFQLEQNNQLSYYFKDVPDELKEKGLGAIAAALLKIFLASFLYNEAKEKLTGSRSAFDPIGILVDFNKHQKQNGTKSATKTFVTDTLEELPFVGGLLGGGRIPISSALPDLVSLAKGESTWGKEAVKPLTYLVPPVGGGQIKKAIEGIDTYRKGGSYIKDTDGKQKLRYPVEQTPGNLVKSALFGKYSTKYAQDYIDRGFKPLSTNQTEYYEKAKEQGISYDNFMKAKDAQKGIEGEKNENGKTITYSASVKKKDAIDELVPGYSQKQKETLYEAFGVSKSVWDEAGANKVRDKMNNK